MRKEVVFTKQEQEDLEKKNKLEILKVKHIIIESKTIIIITLNKLSQWYTGCILREGINDLKEH